MDILRELIGLNITTMGITFDMAWMVLWPVVFVQLYIHYRFLKSFKKR